MQAAARSIQSRRLLCASALLLAVSSFAHPLLGASTGGNPEAPGLAIDAGRPDLAQMVLQLPGKARLQLQGVFLEEIGSVDLELEPFEVFASDAQIRSGDQTRARPGNRYYRGSVAGFPESFTVVSFRERGGSGGYVMMDGEIWELRQRSQRGATMRSQRIDPADAPTQQPFSCLSEDLPQLSNAASAAAVSAFDTVGDFSESVAQAEAVAGYTARIAVESDWEFLQLFGGDETAAVAYIGDIFAFASSLYQSEVDTSLVISHLQLWPGTADDDPWGTGDYDGNGSTSCSDRLYEFRDYWNANRTGVERAVAHFLSGKSLGCGIAYLTVLCNPNYGYGLSSSLSGNFDPLDPLPPVWDIIVVNHEIGHNFGSPHTHCYVGLPDGSYPDAVDGCYSIANSQTCYSGTRELPAGCPGPGNACGTIMSYCHLLGGGYGNIAMTFGGSVLDGSRYTYGNFPERVPQRMYSHVQDRAVLGCLDPVAAGGFTLDVSTSGAGNGNVTSSDGKINCGSDCSETYPEGQEPTVMLTATADVGSSFIGWSGACSGTNPGYEMIINADMSCDASFETTCGNGVIEGDEVCDGADLGGATCADTGCSSGQLLCNATCDGFDYSQCSACACDFDGVCELGEDCDRCPTDCASGVAPAASCGNGICEAGDGEDCVSCPDDCNGLQRGKPTGRFCCGDGDGDGAIPSCDDSASVCNSNGFSCTSTPGAPTPYCCGTGGCEAGESCGNCALDCTQAGEVCGDGIDNDCNGFEDCADAACSLDPNACPECQPKGTLCTQDSECCSGLCEARGQSGMKCR